MGTVRFRGSVRPQESWDCSWRLQACSAPSSSGTLRTPASCCKTGGSERLQGPLKLLRAVWALCEAVWEDESHPQGWCRSRWCWEGHRVRGLPPPQPRSGCHLHVLAPCCGLPGVGQELLKHRVECCAGGGVMEELRGAQHQVVSGMAVQGLGPGEPKCSQLSLW